MPLLLKTVEPARGIRWISDAWRLYMRRPVAFAGLLALWIGGGAILSSLIPVVGSVLVLMSPPLVSLGFMIAGQSVLLDGPVHPRHFAEPLLTDKRRRNALLILCVVYAVLVTVATMIAMQIADEPLSKLAQQTEGKALPREEILALMTSGELTSASLFFLACMTVISAPFWHAPALIHWGGQSAGHALFSSMVAVWRNKLAFAVYFGALTAVGLLALFAVTAITAALLPMQLALFLLMLAWAAVGAVFYLSVLFTFNDSFGGSPVSTDDNATQPDL
jgi:hypothetical protein